MTYCSDCIHYKVCGNEGVGDSAMTFCADKQTGGDLISRKAVLDIFGDIHPLDYNARAYVKQIKELPSAEKTDRVITELEKITESIKEIKGDNKYVVSDYMCGAYEAFDVVFDIIKDRIAELKGDKI